MARESALTVAKRRGLGVLYIVVIIGLVLLSVAFYQRKFTSVVTVTLKTDHTGNQLIVDSDVKVRGIIVGYVKDVKVDSGSGACTVKDTLTCVSVTLALDPGRTKIIPKNVSAQILPKTLFGEQYVSLTLPGDPARSIKSGDTIDQDRSEGALETQKVLGDLLPLLKAVQPDQLNATLTALASALDGRGAKLGQTLVGLDKYLSALNPHASALVADLKKLGQVSLEYNSVTPDVMATLNNLQTSAKTVVEKKQRLDDLLTSVTSTSTIVQSFLADNEQNLITVVGTTDKVYNLLAEYSPEFTCLLSGLNVLADRANGAIKNNQIQLSAQLDFTNLGKYKPGEEPKFVTGYGPSCFGLPNPPVPFKTPAKYQCLNDGAALTAAPCGKTGTNSAAQEALGSPAENALVNTLIASSYGTTPDKVPDIATALAGPLLRGETVEVK
jgi:phospholipid/cholesterol/gamma-HCH transport system substrate-binding protein